MYEKLQTCDFKRKQFQKLVLSIGLKIEYVYLLNDWFKKPEYKDVLDYINSVNCHYRFNTLPLAWLGLPGNKGSNMIIRVDESVCLSIIGIDNLNDKEKIRSYLLKKWIDEKSETKYRYFVETLANGDRICLDRSGRLNKGCDFIIFIENLINFQNGNDKPPKHDFIFDDLKIKKSLLSSSQWASLINAITKIYNCQPYNVAENHVLTLPETNGLSYEAILKLSRWFFIEQDITYWAKSGRKMLYDGILNI